MFGVEIIRAFVTAYTNWIKANITPCEGEVWQLQELKWTIDASLIWSYWKLIASK